MPDLVVDIAVPVAVNKTFHYLVPEDMHGLVFAGSRVKVPFGGRWIIGTVVGFPSRPADRLKSVIEVVDGPVPEDLLSLAKWMSDYYLHPLGLTIEAMIPRSAVRPSRAKKYVRLAPGAEWARPKSAKQAEILRLLSGSREVEMAEIAAVSRSGLKSLKDAGLIEVFDRESTRYVDDSISGDQDAPPMLMPEQAEAVRRISDAVMAGCFETFLLHGVTGSGKTEVYLGVISSIADSGRGAIILVPEIALTPQLLGRFRRRFGSRVAVFHSGLTQGERAGEYWRIRKGDADVVVGARSAVFAPVKRLSVIIVDEEHDNSYKQEEGLRYHGRDVAVMRAKLAGAVCVLGSATPSIETFYNARNGRYVHLAISRRIDDRPMPKVSIVDTKALRGGGVYSPQLADAVRGRLLRGEQSLLLLNRRGFSAVLICSDCGAAQKCPGCSVTLTYHKADKSLKCHYCGFSEQPPDKCPACGGVGLRPLGAGTQRIQEEAAALFPAARIFRMDSDILKGRKSYEDVLARMDKGEVDILLGTQIVAKGHDFPAVTLVGVVDADIGLNLPDFRSAEKTFQLITQAAGRAGRGDIPGEVIIQTMNPGHYAIRRSINHDYDGFYEEEIRFRSQLGYPPYRRMIKIEIKGAQEKTALDAAKTARDIIRAAIIGKDVSVLGPAPAPIARLRGKYRFHVILLSRSRGAMRRLASEAKVAVETKYGRRCRVILDVDPVNLM